MATKPKTNIVTVNPTMVADQLRDIATQVQSGTIKSYEIKQTPTSVTISIDSTDGTQRIIKKQDARPGLVRSTTEHIQKQTPQARRQVVKELVQEGLSQQEIAKRTMMSQKTVSNDIGKLKEDGEL